VFLKFEYYRTGLTNQNSILEEIKSRLKTWNALLSFVVEFFALRSLPPQILKVEIYRTKVYLLFCVGVKLGLLQ